MPETESRPWLILSHAFNMDGRAASQTITDKIPFLVKKGIRPIVISAVTGEKDSQVEHHQLLPVAPSGLKFDLRHYLTRTIASRRLRSLAKGLSSVLLLLPFLLERIFIHLDSHWSWFVSAYCKGLLLIRRDRPEVIFSTGGANSAHFAGYLLARTTGLPWIVEVHDPMVHEDMNHSSLKVRWAGWLEKLICRHADVAWWFTERALEQAGKRHPELQEGGKLLLPGAECPDFQAAIYRPSEQFHIGHFGSLDNTRNLDVILQALAELFATAPQWRPLVRLHVYGSRLDQVSSRSIETLNLQDVVVEHGRLERDPVSGKSGRQQVVEAMRQVDLLLLLHGSGAFCEEYVPSKVYEYFWTQRPIMALTKDNPMLDRMLSELGHLPLGALDRAGAKQGLESLLQRWQDNDLKDNGRPSPYTTSAAVDSIVAWVNGLREPQ